MSSDVPTKAKRQEHLSFFSVTEMCVCLCVCVHSYVELKLLECCSGGGAYLNEIL